MGMGIERLSGLFRRPAVQQARAENFSSSRRAFLRGMGGAAIAVGFGAPVFSLIGCGSSEITNVECNRATSLFDELGKINRDLATTADMSISGGTVRFGKVIPVRGFLQELALGGDLNLKVFANPSLLGADKDGNLVVRKATDGAYESCKGAVADCSPFAGLPGGQDLNGLVPVAKINVVRLPENIAADAPEALSYAVGGKMLHGVGDAGKDADGKDIYAAWKRMEVLISENGALLSKPVWLFNDKLVVEVKAENCNTDDLDNPCKTTVVYYVVNKDGSVSKDTVTGVVRDDLKEAFSYYRIFPDGKYWDTNADGSPKADPSLADKSFEVVADPSVTLGDIIDGNASKNIGGLGNGVDADGNPVHNLDLLLSQQLALGARIVATDMRPGYGSKKYTLTEGTQVAGKKDAALLALPRALYSKGDFDFAVSIEYSGNGLTLPEVEYIYTQALGAEASVDGKNIPDGQCSK